MQPGNTAESHGDLFRARLDQVLVATHSLARPSKQIDWEQVEQRVAVCYADEGRPPRMGVPTRLMVGLHYRQHAFDESDESVCEGWMTR